MKTMTLDFTAIAQHAGFEPTADGRLNLPASQSTADDLANAALEMAGEWKIGDAPLAVTLTGAGPIWAYLRIAHALHGRAVRLDYAAPNVDGGICVFTHGV